MIGHATPLVDWVVVLPVLLCLVGAAVLLMLRTQLRLQAWVGGSRAEPGNLRFDLLQHAVRGNHYTVIEAWENSAALEAHAKAAHTRAFRDAFGPLAGSPLDERIFTALQSR